MTFPLLVVMLGYLLLLHGGGARYIPEVVELTLNLDEEPMDAFLPRMREILADNKPKLIVDLTGHPYLAPKDVKPGSPPGRWIMVNFIAGTDWTTLAFADSTLYFLAFKSASGHWNCFPGFETLFPDGQQLPFDESYRCIDGRENLVQIPLGKAAAIRAVRTLSRYNPSTTTKEVSSRAAVTFMVMIAEALRFKPIRQVFTQDWESESFLNEYHVDLVVSWGQVSYCLWLWEKNGAWPDSRVSGGLEKIGINGAVDALEIVDLLKRPYLISINNTTIY